MNELVTSKELLEKINRLQNENELNQLEELKNKFNILINNGISSEINHQINGNITQINDIVNQPYTTKEQLIQLISKMNDEINKIEKEIKGLQIKEDNKKFYISKIDKLINQLYFNKSSIDGYDEFKKSQLEQLKDKILSSTEISEQIIDEYQKQSRILSLNDEITMDEKLKLLEQDYKADKNNPYDMYETFKKEIIKEEKDKLFDKILFLSVKNIISPIQKLTLENRINEMISNQEFSDNSIKFINSYFIKVSSEKLVNHQKIDKSKQLAKKIQNNLINLVEKIVNNKITIEEIKNNFDIDPNIFQKYYNDLSNLEFSVEDLNKIDLSIINLNTKIDKYIILPGIIIKKLRVIKRELNEFSTEDIQKKFGLTIERIDSLTSNLEDNPHEFLLSDLNIMNNKMDDYITKINLAKTQLNLSQQSQKIQNEERWKKAIIAIGGFGVGFSLNLIPGTSQIMPIIATTKLTLSGLNFVLNKNKTGRIIKKKILETNFVKQIQSKFETSNSGVVTSIKYLKKILSGKTGEYLNIFINGASAGYMVGNVLQSINPKLFSHESVSNIEMTVDSSVETATETIIESPVQPANVDKFVVGKNYDISNIEKGYQMSGGDNAVKLYRNLGKNVELGSIVEKDGIKWYNFKQINGAGYAWIPETDLVDTISEVSENLGRSR